jgi:3-hydroxyacyl-CoA dehydrogenase
MKTGYAWKYGPFENWDFVGVQKGIDLVESEGYKVADWVKEMLASGNESFTSWKTENSYSTIRIQNRTNQFLVRMLSLFLIISEKKKQFGLIPNLH